MNDLWALAGLFGSLQLAFVLAIFADYHKPGNFLKGVYFVLALAICLFLAYILFQMIGLYLVLLPPILIPAFAFLSKDRFRSDQAFKRYQNKPQSL